MRWSDTMERCGVEGKVDISAVQASLFSSQAPLNGGIAQDPNLLKNEAAAAH